MTEARARERFDNKIKEIKRQLAAALYKEFPRLFWSCARGVLDHREVNVTTALACLSGRVWPREWLDDEVKAVREEILSTFDVIQKARIAAESYQPVETFTTPEEKSDADA